MLYNIYLYIQIYLFIYLGFSFTIVLYVCYLLWNDFYVHFIVYDHVHAFVGN